MSLSRRSFFAKLAGAVVAVKAVPAASGRLAAAAARLTGKPVYGCSGGGRIGSIAGGVLTREQVAEWFDVPPELIASAPTPLARTSDELLEESGIDVATLVKEWGHV